MFQIKQIKLPRDMSSDEELPDIAYTAMAGRSFLTDPLARTGVRPQAKRSISAGASYSRGLAETVDSNEELPEIPYTPMVDRSISDDPLTSSVMGPPAAKRSKAAEKMARSRAKQSAKKKELSKAADRAAKARLRADQTDNERLAALVENRPKAQASMARQRADQTDDEREAALVENRPRAQAAKARQRADQTDNERLAALVEYRPRAHTSMARQRAD